jgi:hypothetical protein
MANDSTVPSHGLEGNAKNRAATGILGGDPVGRAKSPICPPCPIFFEEKGEPLPDPDQDPAFPDLQEVLRGR